MKKRNEQAIYAKLCWSKIMLKQNYVEAIFYREELASFFQVQKKFKKLNFSSSCFIAGDSYAKVVCLYVVVFIKHDILHFLDNIHFSKYYLVKVKLKVPQYCFYSLNYSNQTCIQVSKFLCALGLKFEISEWNWDVIFYHKLQFTWFFKRMSLSISFIKFEVESLMT